jgi:hypothetical protein
MEAKRWAKPLRKRRKGIRSKIADEVESGRCGGYGLGRKIFDVWDTGAKLCTPSTEGLI